MKKIVLRASVTASKYSNCLSFDADTSLPIFSLKWKKNRSNLIKECGEKDLNEDAELYSLINDDSLRVSENKRVALAYIGGFIIRKLMKSLDCAVCCEAMIASDTTKKHLSLIAIKDNGGLIYPSEDIVKILCVSEKYFKEYVSGDNFTINASKKLHGKLSNAIITELSTTRPGQVLFSTLLHHDIDTHNPSEDLHSTQIMKAVISLYLHTRLFRYGQEYTQVVLRANSLGKRQQMNKLKLFAGL